MMKMYSFLFVMVLIGIASADTCSSIITCNGCNAVSECGWCIDSASCVNETVLAGCSDVLTHTSEVVYGTAGTNLNPEHIDVYMRVNHSVTLEVEVSTNMLPIDFFIAQDASASMGDDVSKLRGMTDTIADSVISFGGSESRIAVATFVERPVYPMDSSSERNKPYVLVSSFFTADGDDLLTVLNSVSTQGNKDWSEAGTEAMIMGAMDPNVDWGNDTLKIMMVCTDAAYHQAGDGLDSGIFEMNPGIGELIDDGRVIDYPSLSLIRDRFNAKNIIPIFAVLDYDLDVYQAMVDYLGRGAVYELTSDSSNFQSVMESAIEETREEVVLTKTGTFTGTSAISPAAGYEGVLEAQTVTFNITLELAEAFEGTQTLIFSSNQGSMTVDISVIDYECDCSAIVCDPVCNETGGYCECGRCNCNDNWVGDSCDCNEVATCDDGCDECKCGVCSCSEGSEFDANGDCCETTACLPYDCNGNGECQCGQCVCDEGWGGETCTCDLTLECPNNCSGNGECVCGECSCTDPTVWQGDDCGTCMSVVCAPEVEASCGDNVDCETCYNAACVWCADADDTESGVCISPDQICTGEENACSDVMNPVVIGASVGGGLALVSVAGAVAFVMLRKWHDNREWRRYEEAVAKGKNWDKRENPEYEGDGFGVNEHGEHKNALRGMEDE